MKMEIAFETILGCERCREQVESHLQYSPNDDEELYLCDPCMMKEFREAITI